MITNKISVKYICFGLVGAFCALAIVNYATKQCSTAYWDEFVLIATLAVAALGLRMVAKYLIRPFEILDYSAKQIDAGNFELEIENTNISEFITINKTLASIADEIRNATDFIKNIEQGNIDINYNSHANQADTKTTLAISLLNMRDKMKTIALEENERNWAAEGLANFSEILRATQMSVKDFSSQIMSKLVKYVEANQGALFILNKDNVSDLHLELVACYAYNRNKYTNKRIEIGEGLAGQCFLEKDIIYMTDVPDTYVTITSGLGNATPKSILIVPLMINEEVFGVIELSSFDEISKYKIDFILKLGENIASTISAVMVNNSTQKMLEESQQRAEQMKAQEEELRQNMEELSAIQEEMHRKERRIQGLLDEAMKREVSLNERVEEISKWKVLDQQKSEQMLATVEQNRAIMLQVIEELPEKIFLKDEHGKLTLLNSALASGYNKPVHELIGTSDFDHFSHELATQFRNIELDLIQRNESETILEEFPDAQGDIRNLYCVKSPFRYPNSDKVGILGYQMDVTDIKRMEHKILSAEIELKNREQQFLDQIRSKEEVIETQMKLILELQSHTV